MRARVTPWSAFVAALAVLSLACRADAENHTAWVIFESESEVSVKDDRGRLDVPLQPGDQVAISLNRLVASDASFRTWQTRWHRPPKKKKFLGVFTTGRTKGKTVHCPFPIPVALGGSLKVERVLGTGGEAETSELTGGRFVAKKGTRLRFRAAASLAQPSNVHQQCAEARKLGRKETTIRDTMASGTRLFRIRIEITRAQY